MNLQVNISKIQFPIEFSLSVKVLVLGTGSRHAARVYIKEGFDHLLGGLSEARRGYNPEDEGEWMMVRRVRQGNIVPFLPADFYDKSCTVADIEVDKPARLIIDLYLDLFLILKADVLDGCS